jgi:hypothetical protein
MESLQPDNKRGANKVNCTHEITELDGVPYLKGLSDYMATVCANCGEPGELEITDDKAELYAALELLLEDLTENNAHTIAALLESQYKTGYDMDKVHRAYKAAQWELFGTR